MWKKCKPAEALTCHRVAGEGRCWDQSGHGKNTSQQGALTCWGLATICIHLVLPHHLDAQLGQWWLALQLGWQLDSTMPNTHGHKACFLGT